MKKNPKFLPFFVDDWWGSLRVRALEPELRGLYLDLLFLSWELGGPLPTDMVKIRRMVPWELPDDVRMTDILRLFWTLTDKGWVQEHLEKCRKFVIHRNLRRYCYDSDAESDAEMTQEMTPKVTQKRRRKRRKNDVSESESESVSERVSPNGETRLSPDGEERPSMCIKGSLYPERTALRAEIKKLWEEEWGAGMDEPYAFQGAKDGQAVERILRFSRGNLEGVRKRIRILIHRPPNAWYEQNTTLAVLAMKWNELGLVEEGTNGPNEEARKGR